MEGGSIFGGGNDNRKDKLKEIYQQELRQQLEQKNREKLEQKQKELEMDRREEERIRRDLEALNQQYAQEAKEDKNKRRDPFDFSNIEGANVAKQQLPSRKKSHRDDQSTFQPYEQQ